MTTTAPAAPTGVRPPGPARVVAPKTTTWRRTNEIWARRELLMALVRKELKVKYKDSALGFAWSMLNPALYLAVFYVVFSLFLGNGIPVFPVWLVSGLLVWNFFSQVLPSSTGSVVGNSSLVKKVSFPREILPLSTVGAGLVHFALQAVVLVVSLVVFRRGVDPAFLLLVPLAVVTLVLFTSAVAIALSAINVYVRDSQHLLELLLLAWFWMTPIVYPYRLVGDKLQARGLSRWLFMLNPVTPVVTVFQRAFYNRVTVGSGASTQRLLPPVGVVPHLELLGVVAAIGFVALLGAMRLFRRLEGNFAQEL